MTDKKLTDYAITVRALKKILELMLLEGDLQRASTVSHAIDLINRQKAENERLEKQLVFEIESAYDRGRKAAINEFAERVERKAKTGKGFLGNVYRSVAVSEIYILLKEMVGDAY